jgi:hypothetical protein
VLLLLPLLVGLGRWVMWTECPGTGESGWGSIKELGNGTDAEGAVGVDGDGDIASGLFQGAGDGKNERDHGAVLRLDDYQTGVGVRDARWTLS